MLRAYMYSKVQVVYLAVRFRQIFHLPQRCMIKGKSYGTLKGVTDYEIQSLNIISTF